MATAVHRDRRMDQLEFTGPCQASVQKRIHRSEDTENIFSVEIYQRSRSK